MSFVMTQSLYSKFYDCIRPRIKITIHLHVGDCQFEHFMNHGCFLIVWTSECDFCKAVMPDLVIIKLSSMSFVMTLLRSINQNTLCDGYSKINQSEHSM
jgi:hypothetical protein